MSTLDRRSFVGGTAAGLIGAGCGSAPAPAPAPTLVPAPAPALADGLTTDIIASAEKVARVAYTPAERAQLLGAIGKLHKQIAALRGAKLTLTEAPALIFDPRLPGNTVPIGATRVKLKPRPRRKLPADSDIAFASLPQLAEWIRKRQISSVRLTELYQSRLRSIGAKLECVVAETPGRAARQASRADDELARGKIRGPLHGIPYGAKDLFDTANLATTFGAQPFAQRIADRDATVIERLEDAGAVLIAKTTLGALAYGDRWFGGKTRNPWNVVEGSSGSSAGSASGTAAGLFGFSLGTETLGSIISPCARCGCTGLRPTFGRVPRGGAMPLAWSMDKIGPICRTVAGTALVFAAIAGADDGDPASRSASFDADLAAPSLRGLRVGLHSSWLEAADVAIIDRLRAAGAVPTPLELSLPGDALFPILFAEAAAAFEDLTLDGRDDQLVRQDDDAWPNYFRASRFISAVDLVQADRLRRRAMVQLDAALTKVDVLLASPRSPLLVPLNYTGHPALILRSGFHTRAPRGPGVPEGSPPFEAPRSIVLYGKLYDEAALCRAGAALEKLLGVWSRRPEI